MSVGSFKALCLCGILASSCAGQKVAPANGKSADVRPAIFQRGSLAMPVVASPNISKAQLSGTSFHMASMEEVDAMEQTLEQYVAAFESLSLPQVKQVWPDLDQKHSKALKDVFAVFKGAAAPPRLGLTCAIPKVTADTAQVECQETVTYSVGKGKTKDAGPARVEIQLRGESGHWVVQDMKGAG
jgi:hypothetical protein